MKIKELIKSDLLFFVLSILKLILSSRYTQLFNATDRAKTGSVSGAQARSIMLQSRLPQQSLAQIWALADLDSDGKLGEYRE